MTRQLEQDEGVAGALRSAETLRRIAAVLDLPVADFFGPEGERPGAMDQAFELLTTFNAIRDPEARERCLAFVRGLSQNFSAFCHEPKQ